MPNHRLATAAAAILLAAAASAAQAKDPPGAAPLPNASPESVGFSSERLARMDAVMAKVVADGEVAGMSTLVARHGKVVAFHTYGKANIATGAPMTRDAIFRIYSMTKPITGVAMMILFEQGKWRLDDPVTKFIPEFKDLKVATGVDASGKPVLEPMRRPPTMRELMSHTAGFSYGFNPTSPVDKLFSERGVLQSQGLQQMIDRISGVPLLYQPGDRWSYSAAVDIQGYLVEKLSGQSFGQFLQQNIFGPLKMVDTGFYVPADKAARAAAIYETDRTTGKLVQITRRGAADLSDPTKPPSMESGGGGLFSTIDDYSRFAQMLTNRGELDGVRILAPGTVDLMRTNVVSDAALAGPGDNFDQNIGFGLDVMTITDPQKAGHLEGKGTISWEGAAGTIFWSDPANDVTYVGMIQNFTRAGPANSLDSLARPLVYQALVDPEK